jgi:hypothetical protein
VLGAIAFDRKRPVLSAPAGVGYRRFQDGHAERADGRYHISDIYLETRMTDVLIRDVDPSTLARIDAAAERTGVSRNTLLRELLARYADDQQPGDLTDEDITACGASVRDLLDEEQRAAAWRR